LRLLAVFAVGKSGGKSSDLKNEGLIWNSGKMGNHRGKSENRRVLLM
jgi:hypothetical protein